VPQGECKQEVNTFQTRRYVVLVAEPPLAQSLRGDADPSMMRLTHRDPQGVSAAMASADGSSHKGDMAQRAAYPVPPRLLRQLRCLLDGGGEGRVK
jgi:hypothetical protein